LLRHKFAYKRIWIGNYPKIGDLISTTSGEYTAVVAGEPFAISYSKSTSGNTVAVGVKQKIVTNTPKAFGANFDGHVIYNFMWNPWETRYIIVCEVAPTRTQLGNRVSDFIVNLDDVLTDLGVTKYVDNIADRFAKYNGKLKEKYFNRMAEYSKL